MSSSDEDESMAPREDENTHEDGRITLRVLFDEYYLGLEESDYEDHELPKELKAFSARDRKELLAFKNTHTEVRYF